MGFRIELTGKWKYRENYGYGVAEGEVVLQQEKNKLSGRIIFTDKTEGDGTSMIQEFLSGEIEGLKVRIQAREFDVIYSEHKIEYKLDNWFGILVDKVTIKGISVDEQGIEGYFVFEKCEEEPSEITEIVKKVS
ncbi:hypothetical protein [Odoribacter laneus]|uniref:hypothetical protein n=1 Tax=Odoribacter laneus TaxID=626933 RepID=UPI003AF843E7